MQGDYFVNVGMSRGDAPVKENGRSYSRHWDYCRKYGYVSAGGAERFRRFLSRLKLDDSIYAYVRNAVGYVGHGIVTSEAVPLEQFKLGDGTLLVDRLGLQGIDSTKDPDSAEYAVGIRWLQTFALSEGKFQPRIFAPITAVCPIRDTATLDFLRREFAVDEDALSL